jgi:outer membrane protein OmpA-like peptidoglycan-associated protein
MPYIYKKYYFFFLLFWFVNAEAQEVITSESSNYKNLGLNQIEVYLSIVDAEIKEQAVKADWQIYFADTPQSIDSLKQSQQSNAKFCLNIHNSYDLKIKADKYIDTTFRIDLSTIRSYQMYLEVGLVPDKIPFEITILDLNTDELLPLGGLMHNRSRPESILLSPEYDDPGHYRIKVREEDEYEMEVKNNEGYFFYSTQTVIPKRGEENHLKVQVVNELKSNTQIRLYNVNFAYNSEQLNQNAKAELLRVLPLIKNYPSIRLEIATHTDNIGTQEGNISLSEKRANSVKVFLVQQGISENQLITKGYGDTIPIANNDSEAGRAKNRRFELRVIQMD